MVGEEVIHPQRADHGLSGQGWASRSWPLDHPGDTKPWGPVMTPLQRPLLEALPSTALASRGCSHHSVAPFRPSESFHCQGQLWGRLSLLTCWYSYQRFQEGNGSQERNHDPGTREESVPAHLPPSRNCSASCLPTQRPPAATLPSF